MAKKDGLTPKQQMFVAEYLKDLNATQAAIRAGYSKKTAEDIGRQLLRKTPVAVAVQKAMNERAKRTEIDSDYVLNTIQDTVERCRQVEQMPMLGDGLAETGAGTREAGETRRGPAQPSGAREPRDTRDQDDASRGPRDRGTLGT